MPKKRKYPLGSKVQDRESGKSGVVVHHYRDPALKDVVVVKFGRVSVAIHVADLRAGRRRPRIGRRR
jgi:hypothetical protein